MRQGCSGTVKALLKTNPKMQLQAQKYAPKDSAAKEDALYHVLRTLLYNKATTAIETRRLACIRQLLLAGADRSALSTVWMPRIPSLQWRIGRWREITPTQLARMWGHKALNELMDTGDKTDQKAPAD